MPDTDSTSFDGIHLNEKKLVKSVGYTTIYHSHTGKVRSVERSTNGTVIRCKIVRKNGGLREVFYEKVDGYKEGRRIESLGKSWKICGVNGNYDYIIMWQLNAEEKWNGFMKVVEKSKDAVGYRNRRVRGNADIKYWTYYKRRKACL